jgi:hypothetical protein
VDAKDPEEVINHRDDEYFQGVMSKVLMALDALSSYSYGDPQAAEWIFFTDGDVHINAGLY